MGFLDFLFAAATVIDAFSDNDEHFSVTCDVVEVFKIGEQWQGTARVHGAGAHVSTEHVSYNTEITLPKEGNSNYTPRGLLRKSLRDWLGKTFSTEKSIPKDAIVLNPTENCLSFEGFAKKQSGKWMMVSNYSSATNYVSYKLVVYNKTKKAAVGHDELFELFKADTIARVSRVDVKDGF